MVTTSTVPASQVTYRVDVVPGKHIEYASDKGCKVTGVEGPWEDSFSEFAEGDLLFVTVPSPCRCEILIGAATVGSSSFQDRGYRCFCWTVMGSGSRLSGSEAIAAFDALPDCP